MSIEIKVVTCGTQESVTNTVLNIPVANKIVYNAHEIRKFIDKHPNSVLFIILFLDVCHENMDFILNELSQRNNIFAILICDKLIYNSSNNLRNVLRISPHLITNEITFGAIRAYETTSGKFWVPGKENIAMIMEEKANELKRWLTTNSKVESTHIAIIPVNTAYDNLIDFQLNFFDFCKRLYPTKIIKICTLDDYVICEEPPILPDSSFLFRQKQRQIICDHMHELAPIRIYLVGNETQITNEWSKYLLEKELDNGRDNIFEYIQGCTFMENEPVADHIKENLARFLNCQWQVTKTKPKRLDNIESDKNFDDALRYVYGTLEIREEVINLKLCEKYIGYRDTSPDHSSEFHLTGEAQDGPTDKDQLNNDAINTIVLHNDSESSIN